MGMRDEANCLSKLEFRQIRYVVDGHTVLDELDINVNAGETLVLLGRSGSGKTTALRLINRMIEPTSGTIRIDGEEIAPMNAVELRRRIGYVIQDFGLLPHWTIEQNVALVPRLLGWPLEKQRERARELLDQVGLNAGMGHRYPRQLSGGQRQRVGVARALAASPMLLLFDEPFGALDPITRHEMQQMFVALRTRFGGASIFVTHDLAEALSIGSRIAVLEQGRLEGVFTPEDFLKAETPVAKAFLQTLPRGIANA
jgi:osmoprotectant transport system ATP-binding protein